MHAAEAPLVVEDLQWRASLALTLRSVFRCRVIQPRALQRQEMAHPRGDVSIEPDETCPELRRVFPMLRLVQRTRPPAADPSPALVERVAAELGLERPTEGSEPAPLATPGPHRLRAAAA